MVREYMARKREHKPFVRILVKILVILARQKKRVLSEDGRCMERSGDSVKGP